MLAHWILATTISGSYVACMHVRVPREISGRDRNDFRVIQFRMTRVLIVCLAWTLVLAHLLRLIDGYSILHKAVIAEIGAFTISWPDLGYTAVRMCFLYSLSMVEYMMSITRSGWIIELNQLFFNIHGFRNHVFGPVTEEYVYRGLVWVCIRHGIRNSATPEWNELVAKYSTPFLFSIAHIHHYFSDSKASDLNRYALLVQLALQAAYTVMFGLLANQIYMQSKYCLWCPILAHCICNVMGIPDFGRGESNFFVYACYLVTVLLFLTGALFVM